MKNAVCIAIAALFMVAVMGACQKDQSAANSSNRTAAGTPSVGTTVVANPTPTAAATSKLDDSTSKALLEALADERHAAATYEAVLAKFEDERPFSNIVNAERRHESFLLPLFEKYGIPVPENEMTKNKPEAAATLAEACEQGVQIEKANIAMYDKFMSFVKEGDIRETFTYLRNASADNHLPAFERCGSGRGQGPGRGRP